MGFNRRLLSRSRRIWWWTTCCNWPTTYSGVAEFGQLLQLAPGRAGIDGLGPPLHRMARAIGQTRCQQRGGAVHQHDVALSAGLTLQNGRGYFAIARAVAAAQRPDVGLRDAEVRGRPLEAPHIVAHDFENQCGSGGAY